MWARKTRGESSEGFLQSCVGWAVATVYMCVCVCVCVCVRVCVHVCVCSRCLHISVSVSVSHPSLQRVGAPAQCLLVWPPPSDRVAHSG